MSRRPRRALLVRPRITLAGSLTKAVRRHHTGRVNWIGGTGFFFEIDSKADVDLARRMMEFEAVNQGSKTRQAEKVCVDLALDWPAERPTGKEMEAAGREALAALGMGNARALFFGENGWQRAELRIVALKIDPATNRAYQLHRSFTRLAWWARRYGRGWS